ncbi:MAG TPA: aminotransferase class III-fold pyridoxal phosphate-dependent enzyme [Oculatellaceae cyanobacterium]
MAIYRKETERKRFPVVSRGAQHYERIASQALENSIEHLNHAYGQKLCGAEGAVEYRDEGVYTFDTHGKRYLDCLGGYGIFNVGHRHPKVIAAVKAQLDQVCLHSQDLLNPWAGHLARQLAAIAPGDLKYSFFCNSGTEAVEGAIKLARLYTGKTEIISTRNSYHGVSMGALSATGRDVFRKPFEPLLNGFVHVPFGDVKALEAAITENTAAVILEPIQGEGGINVPSEGYLRKVRQLTKKRGVLLILDEVQTGMGRTGRMFACEHEGVVPDILCLAKALGGGVMPIGAFMSTSKIWRVLEPNPSIHNSTFGGNPLACTAASACIEVLLEEHLPARAAVMGNVFMRRLRELKERYPQQISEVRGRGLLIGLQFASKEVREQVQVDLFHKGVLVAATMNANCTIRIEPPLIITEAQINFMVDTLESILREISTPKVTPIRKAKIGKKRTKANA